ncbi:unnamed protein product [Calicophoron daubneyi]|uniref:Uncharacterized protein n=1 Tax=Calicophoron daubneyi TaxID=300641 RepID=A0AAV2TH85_CALDB
MKIHNQLDKGSFAALRNSAMYQQEMNVHFDDSELKFFQAFIFGFGITAFLCSCAILTHCLLRICSSLCHPPKVSGNHTNSTSSYDGAELSDLKHGTRYSRRLEKNFRPHFIPQNSHLHRIRKASSLDCQRAIRHRAMKNTMQCKGSNTFTRINGPGQSNETNELNITALKEAYSITLASPSGIVMGKSVRYKSSNFRDSFARRKRRIKGWKCLHNWVQKRHHNGTEYANSLYPTETNSMFITHDFQGLIRGNLGHPVHSPFNLSPTNQDLAAVRVSVPLLYVLKREGLYEGDWYLQMKASSMRTEHYDATPMMDVSDRQKFHSFALRQVFRGYEQDRDQESRFSHGTENPNRRHYQPSWSSNQSRFLYDGTEYPGPTEVFPAHDGLWMRDVESAASVRTTLYPNLLQDQYQDSDEEFELDALAVNKNISNFHDGDMLSSPTVGEDVYENL